MYPNDSTPASGATNTSVEGPLNFSNLKELPSMVAGDIEERERLYSNQLIFGNEFLDLCLGGLNNSDLVVIGSKTGSGKTDFCVSLAVANAKLGKRVLFYALEAEKREILWRVKFQMIAEKMSKRHPHDYLDYNSWLTRKLKENKNIEELERMVEHEILTDPVYRNIRVFVYTREFTVDTMVRELTSEAFTADLFIIDHLHYFDLITDNENREVKQILKTLRLIQQEKEKPIVLVSHVRKAANQAHARVVHTLDDLHGSSDISKIATKVIAIAPQYKLTKDGVTPTLFEIQKVRTSGDRRDTVAQVGYVHKLGRYEDKFKLGVITDNEFRETVDPSEIPYWAKNVNLTPANVLKSDRWTKGYVK